VLDLLDNNSSFRRRTIFAKHFQHFSAVWLGLENLVKVRKLRLPPQKFALFSYQFKRQWMISYNLYQIALVICLSQHQLWLITPRQVINPNKKLDHLLAQPQVRVRLGLRFQKNDLK
jgi:hypothetical protein